MPDARLWHLASDQPTPLDLDPGVRQECGSGREMTAVDDKPEGRSS